MMKFFDLDIIPPNESKRLESLYKYKILDTGHDQVFGNMAALAATIFNTPIALINFVDSNRVWTKADKRGQAGAEVPRELSVCSLAILNDDTTIFEDASQAQCLLAHPFVTGAFGLRFYAAAPILSKEGYKIGAFCVIDTRPRKFRGDEYKRLEWLASNVTRELERRIEEIESYEKAQI
ncbi:GAF domain-containing protein [Desertivirga brevis]|uniref:GAF domain-containing protein n=1 Tax=Desertivirga brevis TaxID=2810310 RepID=UPI001A95743A|nr:GAF domain-containing protein [Pedobacter sp. SYSU D00873]